MQKLILIGAMLLAGNVLAETGALAPIDLRCERRANPLGVDVPQPLLSWKLEAAGNARGQVQTAYEIQVASSAEKLAKDDADLWASGKISSDATFEIAYAGKPLASEQSCFWRVRVYDRDGNLSKWSEPAMWSMGLLAAADWKAQWIGFDAARSESAGEDFGNANWIWHAADPKNVPVCKRWFFGTFQVPADTGISKAEILITGDDAFEFSINGKKVGASKKEYESWKRPELFDVAKFLKAGPNEIVVEAENTTPSPAGLVAKLSAKLTGGQNLEFSTDAKWQSSTEPTGQKSPAKSLGKIGIAPWGQVSRGGVITPAARYLRTSFTTEKTVKRAVLYASALGIADFYLNGKRVADEWLTPGWSHYPNRVHYRAYDVTAKILRGENALGIALGDGWFSGYVGYGHRRDHYGKKPRALAQIHVTYEDGSEAIVATGPDWKASTGAITEQDFLMGETCDARLEQAGWDAPKFDASRWNAVNVGSDEIKPNLQWHPGPPVIAYAEIKPISVTEPAPGIYVFNLGQNFAGVERLKIRGEAGQKITIRFAERLKPDGTAYTENYRSARSIDTYICKGGGDETWAPRFTFHGFQYVQVEGLTAKPAPEMITGLPLGSDTPSAGEFVCSDEMLTKLGSNTWWTQRSNFIDIPTDCPQRDERLGWTGDAQMYCRAASLHADVQSFFQKWLYDLQDAQLPDGQFACVAPPLVATGGGGPAWIDAGSVCPWTMYDVYGDKRALERMYPNMKRLVASYKDRCSPELKPPAKFHCFGDWLSINATTPNEVTFSAYFALTTKLTAQAAEVLGKADEAAAYRKLLGDIKAAFNRDYVDAEGHVKGQTQTAYVLALQFDLVDGAAREAAAKHLIADIEKHDWHLTTGFVGTKDLMLVLTKIGRTDVAWRLIHNDTFPSWGFSIKNGATTIWERWNGWTPDKGFGDAGMNSFAHYAFGAVYQWMVENIGGIRSAAPAFKRIVIAPTPDDKVTWARTSYDSVNGRIATSWKKDGAKLHLDVEIPPNTTAEIHLPGANADAVTENGKARFADGTPGVKSLRIQDGITIVDVGSGKYSFDVK